MRSRSRPAVHHAPWQIRQPRSHTHRRRIRTRRPCLEALEPRQLLAADWQNASDPLDVNGDGTVTPIDSLLVINELAEPMVSDPARGVLPNPASPPQVPPPYFDVDGDGFVSPADALRVINAINRVEPPRIMADLANDTGGHTEDRITFDPTVSGQIQTDRALHHLHVVIPELEAGPFDVVGAFNSADSTFTLDRGLLEGQLEGPLEDGDYTFRFQAEDDLGNVSESFELFFSLDATPPELNLIAPRDTEVLHRESRLMGTVDGTGSSLDVVQYRFDALENIPLAPSANRQIDRELFFYGRRRWSSYANPLACRSRWERRGEFT